MFYAVSVLLCISLLLGRFAAQGQMNMLISILLQYSDSNLSTEILEFFSAKKRSSSVLFIINGKDNAQKNKAGHYAWLYSEHC